MKTIFTTAYLRQGILLHLAATPQGICAVGFEKDQLDRYLKTSDRIERRSNNLLDRLIACLDNYFTGKRESFDLPLDAAGTTFQLNVWQAVRQIPYGEVKSYRQIAVDIGRPTAVRAVGAANGANPTPLIVPCHRVLCSDGSLGGYRGGRALKQALLELEGAAFHFHMHDDENSAKRR